jgi:hypothetical protein
VTTIVWDGRTLAADRCRSNTNTRELARKLFDCGEYVYGAVGDMHDAPAVVRWLKAGAKWEERPVLDEGGTKGIVVRVRDGALFIAGGKPVTLAEQPRGPTATGSGMDFALAAMRCGKDARAAIAVAAYFDAFTGKGVDAVDVRKARKKKRRGWRR